MNGPQHYREAERLIAAVTLDGTHPDGSPFIRSDEPQTIALAQVHATLALAAATAGLDATEGPNGGSATGRTADDATAWEQALGGGQ